MTEGVPHRTRADRLRRLVRWANRLEVLQVRLLGGSVVSLFRSNRVLVIETTGARTGKRRRAVVSYYYDDGGTFVVGGGAGGMTKVDWVANVRAHPSAVAWVRRRRIPVTVRAVTGEEETRIRAHAFERWPYAPRYEVISGRRIPFFRLTPGC